MRAALFTPHFSGRRSGPRSSLRSLNSISPACLAFPSSAGSHEDVTVARDSQVHIRLFLSERCLVTVAFEALGHRPNFAATA